MLEFSEYRSVIEKHLKDSESLLFFSQTSAWIQ